MVADQAVAHPESNHHGRSEEEAVINPISLFLYTWVSPLFSRGWSRYKEGTLLTLDDLLILPKDETSRVSYDQFVTIYDGWIEQHRTKQREAEEKASREPTAADASKDDADQSPAAAAAEQTEQNPMELLKLLIAVNRRDLLLGVFFRLLQDTGNIGAPFILRALIQWLGRYAVLGEEGGEHKWEGFIYAIVLALNNWILWVNTNTSLFYTNKAFARMRSSLAMAIYEKTLRLDRSQVQNVGRIQQMHSSDTYKFIDMSIFMNSLWAAPCVVIAAMIALYFFVGWAGLLTLALLLVITPTQGKVTSGMMSVRRKNVGVADERIQAVNEFCQGIRIIKFMCWEPSTIANIVSIRNREVARFEEAYRYRSMLLTMMFSTGNLISLAVFGVAYAIGDPVRPANVFPAMAMINILRQPLTQLPLGLARLVDCNVGLRRICEFLALPEKVTYVSPLEGEEKQQFAAVLKNVTAVYEVGGASDPLAKKKLQQGGGRGGGRGGRGGGRGGAGRGGASPSPATSPSSPHKANGDSGAVAIQGGDGADATPKAPLLRPFMGPISVKLPRNKLTIIIGPTGGGKSTLLDMVIGEALIDREQDGLRVATALHDVAYMTQEAWIMNATLKDNILMGQHYDEDYYLRTVNACQLIPDLEQLAGSDQTEIGERGINLSGGQKQRVAFARAVYSNREVVLMDDPLSAVDSHVCTALFHDCIQGVMKDRTRVLVTHQIQFLPEAQHIIVVDNCSIAFQGTYEELQASNVDPSKYSINSAASPTADADASDAPSPTTNATTAKSPTTESSAPSALKPIPQPRKEKAKGEGADSSSGTKLMANEKQELGGIKNETIIWYIRQQGVGWFVFTLICFAIAQAVAVATQLILSWWSAHSGLVGHDVSDETYIMWYGIFIAASFFFTYFQTVPFNITMLNCAKDCHAWMLRSVLRAPTSFYDTTPVGRILSRFSKDLDNMDQQIPWTLGTTYQLVFSIFGSIAIMTYSVQYLLIMWAGTLLLFVLLFVYYGATNRAQKRLEAVNRTPMAAIMNETLGGLSTVRAYNMTSYYQNKHEWACDLTSRSTYSWRLSQRWLSVRIQGVGSLVVLVASVVFCGVIVSLDRQDAIRNLPVMALSLTNSIAMAQFLGILTNLSSELESAMSSVERVKEYCDELPQERDVLYMKEGDDVVAPNPDDHASTSGHKNLSIAPPLPTVWPSCGELIFQHASLRYRDGLPLVLKDMNLKIPHGHKVGVVGRTGSGKSTLMLALFRILEIVSLTDAEMEEIRAREEGESASSASLSPPAAAAAAPRIGSILLDGRDIATIALHDLRSAITIIPQDPLLFAGTVRSNVDPFSQHSDDRVWAVLGQVGLRSRILQAASQSTAAAGSPANVEGVSPTASPSNNASSPVVEATYTADAIHSALECHVAARGSNFSVGQRQLLCLARALLKDCRLLLLDEATASVDQDTDAKIQRTIRENFSQCTVLTIAHRLQTIMDSDKVLVMDHGEVLEYDSPHALLRKPHQYASSSTPAATEEDDGTSTKGRREDRWHGAHFRAMVEALGEEQTAAMIEIAARAADSKPL